MVKEIFFLVEESLEGGFEAKSLGFSIFAQADDIESLKNEIKDVVQCHFDEQDIPKIIRLHIVREEVITA